MLLSRVPGFFRSEHESESQLARIVDTIISIKTFDIKNEMRRGVFILKNRGHELRSQLQAMDIDSRSGITVSDKGWEFEGMLSGETGTIREPEVFVKLFYENPAEEGINGQLIEEFKRRYANKGRFTEVRKAAIYSEFWSFKGHWGAGHANTRVVSISMYIVEAFRALDRLLDLDQFFPEQLMFRLAKDFRWKRYRSSRGTYDSIPSYVDLGLLIAQRPVLQLLGDAASELFEDLTLGPFDPGHRPSQEGTLKWISWDSLVKLTKSPEVNAKLRGSGKFVFSLPYLYNRAEFMAFFFEILWGKGGDIYHFPIAPEGDEDRMRFYKRHILANKSVWREFVRVVRGASADSSGPVDEAVLAALVRRLQPLGAVIAKKYGSTADGNKAAEYLSRFVDAVEEHVIPKLPPEEEDADAIALTPENPFARSALEFIYDLVFDRDSSVPNPHGGEFSRDSMFCRKWYSQIEDLLPEKKRAKREPSHDSGTVLDPKERDSVLTLHPLPYFTTGDRRRSCTTENVWCLALIKDALSPEIGWIFIDTLTSPDWVDKRARSRRGFPHWFEEVKAMSHYDQPAFEILADITRNKQVKESIYHAKTELVNRQLAGKDFETQVGAFLGGEYHNRDVSEIFDALKKKGDDRLVLFRQCVPQELRQLENERSSHQSDFEPKLALRSKLPANRPFFHRVELVLHEELVKLFSPLGRRYWYRKLCEGGSDLGKPDEEIDEALRACRDKEKKASRAVCLGQDDTGLISCALKEMYDALVFDLLTSMPGEVQEYLP